MVEPMTEEDAVAFFSEFYRGEHHFPGKLKKRGDGWTMTTYRSMATYDGDELTRLVLLAHKRCVRAQIEPASSSYLRIAIWQRERTGQMHQRHPTIEQVLNVEG